MTRLIFDVTSLLLWSGPPSGIVRVESALAAAALARPHTVLAAIDRAEDGTERLRSIDPAYCALLLGWSASLAQRSASQKVDSGMAPMLASIERRLLTCGSPAIARITTLALRVAARAMKHTPWRFVPSGQYARIPTELGLGPDLDIGPGDTVFTAGLGWSGGRASCIALAHASGARTAILCYDLIPVTHSHFYPPAVTAEFRAYWGRTLPLVDAVIHTAACIGDDIRQFCQTEALPVPRLVQHPLGYHSRPPSDWTAPLPDGLLDDQYVLLVSTIEPRKGHAMLLRAWRRLLDRQVPQRTSFRLVIVGRWGWLMDEVKHALSDPALGGTVIHFSHANDALLERLYCGAAFCVYPSIYEGFGLPVIEAFSRGKPVLVSSAGAVAETAGQLAPSIDPLDDGAWADAMAEWIDNPEKRDNYARQIRDSFEAPDWPAAATAILDAVACPAVNGPPAAGATPPTARPHARAGVA